MLGIIAGEPLGVKGAFAEREGLAPQAGKNLCYLPPIVKLKVHVDKAGFACLQLHHLKS